MNIGIDISLRIYSLTAAAGHLSGLWVRIATVQAGRIALILPVRLARNGPCGVSLLE